MKSMTGYGKFTLQKDERLLTIELKSVNNRYLEINSRTPKSLSSVEDVIKRTIKENLARGTVDVYFSYVNSSTSIRKPKIDEPLAREYIALAEKVSRDEKISNNFGVAELFKTPDVIVIESENEEEEELKILVQECVKGACDKLNIMRLKEGEEIKKDLTALINEIEINLTSATSRTPFVVQEYSQKLRARIEELMQGVEIDETRLANEVAFFADKVDVNEEIQRLTSHINQFRQTLDSNEPQGRGLDFLSQEIGREINTLGSKSNDKELTNYVLRMKNVLEKIKEQIRNVE